MEQHLSTAAIPRAAASTAPAALCWARVAFTGELASMTRAEAFEAVRRAGGEPLPGVTRATTVLVVGMYGWPLLPDGTLSRKLQRAQALNRRGGRVQISAEQRFLEVVGLNQRQALLSKRVPAEEVCQLLSVTAQRLEGWEQLGLVRSVEGHYDFQDLVSLRTVLELLQRDVRADTISRSLAQLQRVLPGLERPLAQLSLIDHNRQQLLARRGGELLSPDGQLYFDFEPAVPETEPLADVRTAAAVSWFERGQVLEDQDRLGEAAAAYRQAVGLDPELAEAHFNLGNVCAALGDGEAAERAYRAAVQADPMLAEAWFNLADLLEQRGWRREAVDCLCEAVTVRPSYADAHFNLALGLERLERKPEADRHWLAYLQLEPHSEWAKEARMHLALRRSGRSAAPTSNERPALL